MKKFLHKHKDTIDMIKITLIVYLPLAMAVWIIILLATIYAE